MKLKFDVTSEELSGFLKKQYRVLTDKLNDAVDRKDYTQAKTLLERVSEMDELMGHNLVPNSIANVVIRVDVIPMEAPLIPAHYPSPL